MARSFNRLLAGALLLLQCSCGRVGGVDATRDSGTPSPQGRGSSVPGKLPPAHSAHGAVTGSGGLHPALGGHPPSYWQERGQRAVTDGAPIPEEVWGRRFRYRTSLRGTIGAPCLCQGRGFSCEPGPVVKGLTWARIPWARKVNGALEAYVELVGILSKDALTLTESPRRPPRIDEAETLTSLPLPCEKPVEGWRVRDPRLVAGEDEQAATAYAEKQPEHSATWLHGHPFVARAERARFLSDKGVMVFTFTENLETHRERLTRLWAVQCVLPRPSFRMRCLAASCRTQPPSCAARGGDTDYCARHSSSAAARWTIQTALTCAPWRGNQRSQRRRSVGPIPMNIA